jgi:hypothetical protein
MMRSTDVYRAAVPLALLALFGSELRAAQISPTCSAKVAAARNVEKAWLESYLTRDWARMAALVTDDFTITHTDARVQGKRAMLEEVRSKAGTPGPTFLTNGVAGRCYGGTVILTGWVGEPGRQQSRYTDTYVRIGRTWRVAASHLSRPRVSSRS